jgi:Family of unknown function (DUF5662)
MSDQKVDPGLALVASHLRHLQLVRAGLRAVVHDLERRAEIHDLSKMDPAGELPGYVRLSAAASQHAYSSKGYRAAIEAEAPTVAAHYQANGHHPEHYPYDLSKMGWLDLIEMVADWWSACHARGGTWSESLRIGLERWEWTPEQRWLIEQVGAFLVGGLAEVTP